MGGVAKANGGRNRALKHATHREFAFDPEDKPDPAADNLEQGARKPARVVAELRRNGERPADPPEEVEDEHPGVHPAPVKPPRPDPRAAASRLPGDQPPVVDNVPVVAIAGLDHQRDDPCPEPKLVIVGPPVHRSRAPDHGQRSAVLHSVGGLLQRPS